MFRLHKWYLDCVTPAADAVVVYAATLQWGIVRLGYSAVLWHRQGQTRSRTRLGRPPTPRSTADGFAVDAPRLGLRGSWSGALHSRQRELWRSPRGAVVWNCHLPLAEVELEVDGTTLRGSGYVEHLQLDVAPWHLPIQELRWGRFHGGGRSLVWIQWSGAHSLRLCLSDGEAVEVDGIGDSGFELGDGRRLQLAPPAVLRDGELGSTVLRERLLRFLPLPRAVRGMRETKWLAAGTLVAGADRVDGIALHEVVRWR